MKQQGVAVILVEHRIDTVLSIADRVAFIENGRCPEIADVASLKDNQDKIYHYLGIS